MLFMVSRIKGNTQLCSGSKENSKNESVRGQSSLNSFGAGNWILRCAQTCQILTSNFLSPPSLQTTVQDSPPGQPLYQASFTFYHPTLSPRLCNPPAKSSSAACFFIWPMPPLRVGETQREVKASCSTKACACVQTG